MPHTSILAFKPLTKNTLRGFASVRFPSGLVMHEVGIHTSNGKAWAAPPARPIVGKDGRQLVDDAGKPRWQVLVEFASKELRDAWSTQIIAAMNLQYPEVLSMDLPARRGGLHG
jgi:hypothetical protein